jgi:hypothetical protein
MYLNGDLHFNFIGTVYREMNPIKTIIYLVMIYLTTLSVAQTL